MPGIGTSGLFELLLKTNATLFLNDISSKAIEKLKKRFPKEKQTVQWICQDIARNLPLERDSIDIWLDRAVLHFLLDPQSIESYFKNVRSIIKPGGHALFAEFSKSGALKCAGLEVKRYDVKNLSQHLPGFSLVATEEFVFVNPYGQDRPYVYALFKKENR